MLLSADPQPSSLARRREVEVAWRRHSAGGFSAGPSPVELLRRTSRAQPAEPTEPAEPAVEASAPREVCTMGLA